MIEIRKDIKGYEGIYMASIYGEIKSFHHKNNYKDILLKSGKQRGYCNISLYKMGIGKTKKIHKIIAETFIPNPENKSQINHKNGIRDDNRVENLEWCTGSENMKHSYKALGRKNYLIPTTNMYNNKKVFMVHGNNYIPYKSISFASRETGICRRSISKCINGIYNIAGGYKRVRSVSIVELSRKTLH